jgi:hypothetical protein
MNNLNKLLKGENILGLTNVHFKKNRICSACQARKQVGVPHPAKNVLTTTRPLELLHIDMFGHVVYVSIGGNKYDFVIVDDYSRYTWVFFMKDLKPQIFIENLNPCTIAIVPGSEAIAYRMSHR